MPLPRFEVPSGAVDGVNTVFTVSQPYQPGSTAVFLNGLLTERTLDDGWTETDPSGGVVTLKEAPKGSGDCPDVVQVFYLDTSPALPETEITQMSGTLDEVDALDGQLVDAFFLSGAVEPSPGLSGTLLAPLPLAGSLGEKDALAGVLEVCD